jgi:hypothetical protein
VLIDSFMDKKSVTLKQIQKLTGLLNWICGIIVPGRAFSRRLYDITKGITKPFYKVRLTQGVKQDLTIWKSFLHDHNGKSFFLDYIWLSSDVLQLFTDAAASKGYAAVFGDNWLYGAWEPQCKGLSIAVLEFYPILLAVMTWAECLANKCILLRSDNLSVVYIINKNTIMVLVRQLVLICLKYNIYVKSQHIPGKQNVISDLLSRLQVQKAKEQAPYLQELPTPVPQQWALHRLLKI